MAQGEGERELLPRPPFPKPSARAVHVLNQHEVLRIELGRLGEVLHHAFDVAPRVGNAGQIIVNQPRKRIPNESPPHVTFSRASSSPDAEQRAPEIHVGGVVIAEALENRAVLVDAIFVGFAEATVLREPGVHHLHVGFRRIERRFQLLEFCANRTSRSSHPACSAASKSRVPG